ncbi:MAG TPA: TonB family protein [Thermodesulfobacteriota bacterium]|nr:TonB family protein [Thermodesulfobacteriota bacterium]
MVKVLGNNTFLDETKLIKMVVFSGFVHFLAIFLFVFLPNLSSRPTIRIIPQYTPVALVGPGELGGGGKSSVKPVTVPKARVNVAVKKPELIQKKVETKPIEISKTEPKTATPPKEETHNSQAQDQKVNQAIENIRERVGGEQQAANTGGSGGVGVGVTQEGGGSGAPEMVVYMSIVVDRIMEAWFLPPGLKEQAINQGLLTTIDIRIDREGKVSFQAIEQSSGNSVYDDFALKAIQKIQVTSFPPLPEVYRESYLDLGIKFNPSEVNS